MLRAEGNRRADRARSVVAPCAYLWRGAGARAARRDGERSVYRRDRGSVPVAEGNLSGASADGNRAPGPPDWSGPE